MRALISTKLSATIRVTPSFVIFLVNNEISLTEVLTRIIDGIEEEEQQVLIRMKEVETAVHFE